ncbi:MAG: hypothetical protein HGA45_13770 [Chloroflexales bacterium]|nr:hypothetical protein [Chloroflexales bacterium]
MNNFVDLLKRAFGLWWREKILWPLGMLAALVGYGDAAANGNVNISQPSPSASGAAMPPWVEDLAQSELVQSFLRNPWPYLFGLLALVLVWSLVAALVGALAHGSMIRVADVADQGYAASLGDGLRVGAARMGPIFLLNLILALPVIIIVGIVAATVAASVVGALSSLGPEGNPANPGAFIASLLGLIFCVLGIILLLALVAGLLGIWSRVAQRACVIEILGPVASLGRGWQLIRRNLGLTLLTWLFQGVLGWIIGFILAIPALAIAVPRIFSPAQGGSFSGGLIVALIAYVLLASVLVGGTLTAFNSAMWTVLYRAFIAREAVALAPAPPIM